MLPFPEETGQVDMDTFGRPRSEIRHIMVHRLAGERSQFDGAPGRPRPPAVHEALLALATEWHVRSADPTQNDLAVLEAHVEHLLEIGGMTPGARDGIAA
eukprot:10157252-Alexandrium_andersonii.AAC.1